jgi:transposase
MRKLEIKNSAIMKVAIQNEIQRSEESRYAHRLHGILLVSSGLSCYQVANFLGQSPRTVQYWVQRFEHKGFSGLQEGMRSGRPAGVGEKALAAVEQDLRQQPQALGYHQNLWDGKLLSHHLWQTYNIKLGVRQCQRLFGTFGFRRRKPRPVIANADPQTQTAFKKTPPHGKKG